MFESYTFYLILRQNEIIHGKIMPNKQKEGENYILKPAH